MPKFPQDRGGETPRPSSPHSSQVFAPIRPLKRVFQWLFTSIRGVIICAVTATMLLVAMTHTIGWAFALTESVLRAGLKATTISAQTTQEVADLRARNKKLDAELSKARNAHADTKAQLTTSQSDLKKVKTELIEAGKPRRVTFRGEKVSVEKATQATMGSLRKRTHQTAATNAASVFGESIPFYGIAVIVAATSFEIGMACKDMDDLYELQIALDPDSKISDDRDEVCGLQIPTREEIWAKIKSSPGAIWDETKQALKSSGAAISNLPTPNFSGIWQSALGGVGRRDRLVRRFAQ